MRESRILSEIEGDEDEELGDFDGFLQQEEIESDEGFFEELEEEFEEELD
jgi:hypothetical protein